ncbi:hypothetical protein [Gallaecimonas xiamenensis]|uniref:GRAM domain-containing protein n=1 Tax=Gallaecimonas xiamenensis 3-C-1 TaxID=745411 RepID=K2K4E1_9GAMM|nr:hypothetical protein [Gallaecimonas xiamenensis]EKE77809.1 hypothetical protein B3C1_00075 [Gallaecimonas xiamenensis 3-C-1]
MLDGIIKSSPATVQDGVAKADGKLSLTDSEVAFFPFNDQFGLGPYRFQRSEIASVVKCLGKGGGIIPITTDAIRITLLNELRYEFIVAEAEEWIAALEEKVN